MKIVTHSGSWHADEVLAIALLARVLGEVPEVTRTRDPKVIQEALEDKATYVLDVGDQYHPLQNRFLYTVRRKRLTLRAAPSLAFLDPPSQNRLVFENIKLNF